ncbi:MAG: HrgA protein [Eubacterium sp.]|jgi:hypothetical protein|nr:HrgA protein [Eubacterium sp.]
MYKKKSKYTYLNLAEEVIREAKKPLTIAQIWRLGESRQLTEKLGSVGKTPINTLQARMYIDLRDNEKSIFVQISKRPSMFFIKNMMVEVSNDEQQQEQIEISFHERDLHKLLSTYVDAAPEFGCKTKTIYHEKTVKGKKGFNEWLHPDIVGVHFPFSDYQDETLDLQKILGDEQYTLFSFELKIDLGFSNFRQYYFQAVSNSSWAHEGYIVALNIDEDESFMQELKRLNNAFGIGVIKLNPENISQSQILLTSKINKSLDWETIDRLCENPDFKEFAKDVKYDADNMKIRGKYDDVFDDDESAEKYARSKKII